MGMMLLVANATTVVRASAISRPTQPPRFLGYRWPPDVILFREAHGVTDPFLWAHELTHVLQYQHFGVPAFATRYLERGWELEAEAMEKADAIGRQLSP
jgi:hypothetical protein